MNHKLILKRAWKILFSYKSLWVFGFFVALTTGSSSGGGRGSSNHGGDGGNNFNLPFNRIPGLDRDLSHLPQDLERGWQSFWGQVIASNGRNLPWEIILPIIVLLFLLMIVFLVIRQVSRVSLIRMVNEFETTAEKLTWKQGLRLGWSRAAWRIFLIDLLIGVFVMILVALAMGCIAVPFILGGGFAKDNMSITMIIAAIGLFFMFLFAFIFLAVSISLVLEPVYRACVIEDLGVMESISRGWKLVRSNLKDIFLMWLLLIGVQIVYMIVIIPVALLVGGVALLIGGGLGAAVYFLNSQVVGEMMKWLPALITGGVAFLIVFGLPMTFVEGLKETYLSTSWTLAYRELNLMPSIKDIETAPPMEAQETSS